MYNKFIKMVPLVSADKLFIRWILPYDDKTFNMGNFFKDLFDSENEGSLCTILSNSGKISNLCAEITRMCNYFEFSLEFDLNSVCFDNIRYIIGALHKYIDYLRSIPIDSIKKCYNHLQEVKNAKFNNIIGTLDPGELVVNISTHGENFMLTDNYNYTFEYDTFSNFLEQLTDANVNMVCMSRSFHKECKTSAPYFNIRFSVEDLPFYNTRMKIHFSLPCIDRKYLSTDFRIKPCRHKRQYPTIIDEESCVWFRQDYTAKIPVVHVCALLDLGPDITNIATAHVLVHGFVTENNVFFDGLRTLGCDTDIEVLNGYISINLTGYSDKIESVWKAIVEKFAKFQFTEEGYENAKDMVMKELTEIVEPSPSDQILEMAYVTFGIERFPKRTICDHMEEMSENDEIKIHKVIMLIQGNIYKSEALGLYNIIKRTLKTERSNRSVIIPKPGSKVQIKTESDTNCIGLIAMTGNNPFITTFLNKYIDNRLFDELRNRQQLGYIVQSRVIENSAQTGILVIVQSEKYSTEELFRRVTEFFTALEIDHAAISQMIHSSTGNEYESLADEFSYNLREIRRGTLMFNRNESYHSVIRSLFSRRVAAFYKQHFVRNPRFVYLESVQ